MVENRNAITRWRDGFGEMAGRGVGLAGELAQYRYVRVARIMLEAAFRTDHDLALAWPASKMPSAKGIADRRAGAARINGSGRDASRCHNLMHHVRATVQ